MDQEVDLNDKLRFTERFSHDLKPPRKIFSTKGRLADCMGLTTNNTKSRWRIRYKQHILVNRRNKHDNQTNSRYAMMHARSIIPHQVIANN